MGVNIVLHCVYIIVYEVLDVMKGANPSDQFMSVFHRRPVAAALYKKACVDQLITHCSCVITVSALLVLQRK